MPFIERFDQNSPIAHYYCIYILFVVPDTDEAAGWGEELEDESDDETEELEDLFNCFVHNF